MKTDDLSNFRQEIVDPNRRIRELENTSPLESASVSKGRLRFIGGLLRIDSGGRVEIVGTLEVEGATSMSGDFAISGDTDISGSTDISGPTTITGTLDIDGNTTLTGALTVDGGGEITVSGATPIRLGANGSGLAVMSLGSSEIRGADNGIVLDPGAGAAITTGSSGVRIFMLPDAPAGATPNLHINSLGYLSVIR